ncbi:MAG: AmmeMemoRadiSam system protein B [Pseudomonadota bacterium]
MNIKSSATKKRKISISLVFLFSFLLFYFLDSSIPKSPNPQIPQFLNPSIPKSLNPSIPKFLNFSYAEANETKPVRLPAVAGSFYPSDEKELRTMVQTYLRQAGGVRVKGKIHGLVAPHAGYIYSGIVAAAGYKQINPALSTVIIIAPSHRIAFQGASIPDVSAYRTPLGDVPLAKAVTELRKQPGITSLARAHTAEHSLEVQLPFLQEVLERFDLIPLVVGDVDPQSLADTLLPYINKNTLVVASTDLSHYYPYKKAVSMDSICTKAISSLDFDAMRKCEACGKLPVLTLMHIARAKGWNGVMIDYKNSGDTGGLKNRVVGYAGIAFTGGLNMTVNQNLPSAERKFLLKLARSVIAARLKGEQFTINPDEVPEALQEQRGCFVTLHIGESLRGCIGTLLPVDPLYESIHKNALNAAFRDPRFPPLTLNELDKVHLEISVLTVPETISFTDGEDLKRQLKPNVHGVILSQGGRSSTFLPQVWEQLPDKEEFLEHLCLKGWMSGTCWKDPKTKVEVYEAEVFAE